MPTPTDDEAILLGRMLRRGDTRALELLLRRHAPSVLGQLRRRFLGTLTHEDLEDVIAEALNAIWFARARFDHRRGRLGDWFFQVAVNLAIDHARRKERRRALVLGGHVVETIAGATAPDEIERGPSPNGRASLFEHVQEIIDRLPDAQRAIILADIKHYPDPAPSDLFGAEIGISRESVPEYRRRAHKKVRAELRRLGYHLDPSQE